MKAIILHEHGVPQEVARCEATELPPPAPGEVRVRVLYAPINPADVNVLQGTYPRRPVLPGTPGVEGVGELESGERVLLPGGWGSWREEGNVAASALIPLPAGLDAQQAAMLRINPPTALRMLRDFVSLQSGEWIVQNAANSGVGRCVIQLSRHFGWRTLNIVRRPDLAAELTALGADIVLVESPDLAAQIATATNNAPIRLALNAVGGESALALANVLADSGVLVTYGAMARQPMRVPNGLLIFRDIAWRGFWITRWFDRATPAETAAMFAELGALLAAGALHVPIEAVYPLDEIATALAHAQRPQRGGKVLLQCAATASETTA